MQPELFVGVTTWNSERFLTHCLKSVRSTTSGLNVQLGVVDNVPIDRSVAIARDFDADVRVEHCSQSIALNRLLSMSKAKYTLLIHSDVVLLSPRWLEVCANTMRNGVALVSPEDIGCGPLTRPYGRGKPESCFMFFDTEKARQCREWVWRKRRGIPWPDLRLDFDDYYVTHDLPTLLERNGFSWHAMRVHASPREPLPVYEPPFTPEYWSDELGHLRYGMENFYSLGGEFTHYHNWFDRVPKDVPVDSFETTEGHGKGLPLAYLSDCTRRFFLDLEQNQLVMPSLYEPQPEPKQTPRWEPDLARPFASRVASSIAAKR